MNAPSLLITLSLYLTPAVQAAGTHQHHSPYAGEEQREIKSLSNSDITTLRQGGGWGLAKAGELNGYPGPIHVLEMQDKMTLSAHQLGAMQQLVEKMRSAAILKGEELIEAERVLEQLFQSHTATPDSLQTALNRIGEARTALRYIHLLAHLETVEILSPEQVEQYNQLRGYNSNDPCTNIPEGHDPTMWKMHNGCN